MRLVTAFGAMDAPDPENMPPLVDELDLWVTATDLDGKKLRDRSSGTRPLERRLRQPLPLPASRRRTGATTSSDRDNSFLAFAARCTSAFPFAFEAMRLSAPPGLPERRSPTRTGRASIPTTRRTSSRRAASRTAASSTTSRSGTPPARSVGRRAPLPVDRKLIYVEPDPSAAAAEPRPEPQDWNGLQTAQAAAAEDPARRGHPRRPPGGAEPQPRDRAGARHRSRAATDPSSTSSIQTRSRSSRRRLGGLGRAVARPDDRAPATGARRMRRYHRLKVRGARRLPRAARRSRPGARSRLGRVARRALPRPRVEGLALRRAARRPSSLSENRLLLDFSLPYRWRRLDYVLKRLGASSPPTIPRSSRARARPACGLTPDELPAERDAAASRSSSSARGSPPPRTCSTPPTASSPREGPLPPLLGRARHRQRADVALDPRHPRRPRDAGARGERR